MITDEQIGQIAKNYIRHVGSHYINEMAMPDDGGIEEFARELIALAQQVKPLVFTNRVAGDLHITLTPFGNYFVATYAGKWYFEFAGKPGDSEYDSFDEAIAAANEDYQRRVLSCLVHGGV